VNIDPEYSEIEAGESVVLTATGADNYTWSPSTGLSCTDCPNPTASPDVTTTYYVTATDDNGCTGGDTALVVIKLPCGEIFVPTIFSPNGTGPQKNNNLCVFGTAACVEELIFEVYDRWGEKVFETTDITKCWDGNYKDKPMNSGIYVYRLYVKLWNNDEAIEQSGNTTLVR
jgi:gliding motility-associated-like protein